MIPFEVWENEPENPNGDWMIGQDTGSEMHVMGMSFGDERGAKVRAEVWAEAYNMLQLLKDISQYWPISGYNGDGMMTVNIKGASYRELQRIINTLKSKPTIAEFYGLNEDNNFTGLSTP